MTDFASPSNHYPNSFELLFAFELPPFWLLSFPIPLHFDDCFPPHQIALLNIGFTCKYIYIYILPKSKRCRSLWRGFVTLGKMAKNDNESIMSLHILVKGAKKKKKMKALALHLNIKLQCLIW